MLPIYGMSTVDCGRWSEIVDVPGAMDLFVKAWLIANTFEHLYVEYYSITSDRLEKGKVIKAQEFQNLIFPKKLIH